MDLLGNGKDVAQLPPLPSGFDAAIPESKGCATPSRASCMSSLQSVHFIPVFHEFVISCTHALLHTDSTCAAPGHTDGQLCYNAESAAALQLLLSYKGCIRLSKSSMVWVLQWAHVL
jgi:hypothetical protein